MIPSPLALMPSPCAALSPCSAYTEQAFPFPLINVCQYIMAWSATRPLLFMLAPLASTSWHWADLSQGMRQLPRWPLQPFGKRMRELPLLYGALHRSMDMQMCCG